MKKLILAPVLLSSYLMAQDIQLNSGWNFVSIVEDVNYTLTDLGTDLSGKIQDIVGFNGTQTVLFNNITNIEPNKGYWIKVSESASFSVSGSSSKATLTTGWNATGFPTTQTLNDWASSMGECGYTVQDIVGFNGTQTVLFNNIANVEAGKGYWVKISAVDTSASCDSVTIENPPPTPSLDDNTTSDVLSTPPGVPGVL